MTHLVSIGDLQRRASAKLPDVVLDYVEGGAEDELTLRANRQALDALVLRPRGAVVPAEADLRVTVCGQDVQLPVLLAPCGMASLVRPHAEVLAARAAARAGTVLVMSTMSGDPVEDVVGAAGGHAVWFQLYRMGDDAHLRHMVDRVRRAGVGALVVTIDTPVVSVRRRDRRNGGLALLNASVGAALSHLPGMLRRPAWLARQLRDRHMPPVLANVPGPDGRPYRLGRHPAPVSLAWDDIRRVRSQYDGPLVVKGVLTGPDAVRSVDVGASAIVVSNHGGRQLDGVAASITALPEVVAAVGSRCDVLLDSGVRSGTDIVKAMALGATAVMVGRPWLYGLAAAGEEGIDTVLDLLRESTARSTQLMGMSSMAELRAEPEPGHSGIGPIAASTP